MYMHRHVSVCKYSVCINTVYEYAFTLYMNHVSVCNSCIGCVSMCIHCISMCIHCIGMYIHCMCTCSHRPVCIYIVCVFHRWCGNDSKVRHFCRFLYEKSRTKVRLFPLKRPDKVSTLRMLSYTSSNVYRAHVLSFLFSLDMCVCVCLHVLWMHAHTIKHMEAAVVAKSDTRTRMHTHTCTLTRARTHSHSHTRIHTHV